MSKECPFCNNEINNVDIEVEWVESLEVEVEKLRTCITVNYLYLTSEVLSEVKNILFRKHNDYGSENLIRYGLAGVISRVQDKLNRIKNYIINNDVRVDESIEDTIHDIIGYLIQCLILFRERK